MDDKQFEHPVTISIDGEPQEVASVRQAYDLLADVAWPGERDDRHAEASDACLKVLDGHRSVEDAERAFRDEAERAGLIA